MADNLEAPGTDDAPDWASIYRARGYEVVPHRPIFTGDIFCGVQLATESKPKTLIILQHPCAIRTDGVTLVPRILVAEVQKAAILTPSKWASGHFKQMPLADLIPGTEDKASQHYSAMLHMPHLATPAELQAATRIACMSQTGVNLLLQRWVHHNSRAIVATHLYQEVSSAQFEEADITEDWCIDREEDGVDIATATTQIDAWLSSATDDGSTHRDLLKNPQKRSHVRKAMRSHLQNMRDVGE
ncbi:hypothetical protein [Mycobacterium asiaticum]|uniref:Uncharacterized protein n=1 Tax=Mycobacterium asiaticum TaxID=1790 RepID=A0A1A3MYU3_MYCAS|nr:hypothetical protein [Mycobacterium asiaticum]OBK13969.1 hypothetical protein A5636_08770 [Mycobacterium asiaticum]